KATGRHRIGLGYLMTTPAIAGTGMSHGVDVRYAFNIWGPLELGLAAQVGYGSGDQDQHMTRFAGLIYWGAQYLPKPWMALRLDAGLGWQLLSGKYFLNNDEHNQPVFAVGTEPRSLRFEAAGGLGFNVASNLWILVRGGLALDAVFPANNLQSVTQAGGFLNAGVQFQL